MSLKQSISEEVAALAFKTVAEEESIVNSKLLDSITVVDLAVALEGRYGVTIPFNEITPENFDTVELIATYLKSKGVSDN